MFLERLSALLFWNCAEFKGVMMILGFLTSEKIKTNMPNTLVKKYPVKKPNIKLIENKEKKMAVKIPKKRLFSLLLVLRSMYRSKSSGVIWCISSSKTLLQRVDDFFSKINVINKSNIEVEIKYAHKGSMKKNKFSLGERKIITPNTVNINDNTPTKIIKFLNMYGAFAISLWETIRL